MFWKIFEQPIVNNFSPQFKTKQINTNPPKEESSDDICEPEVVKLEPPPNPISQIKPQIFSEGFSFSGPISSTSFALMLHKAKSHSRTFLRNDIYNIISKKNQKWEFRDQIEENENTSAEAICFKIES